MYYKNLSSLIGNTPMLEAAAVEGQQARIVLKLEYFNPGGSVKDRIALAMIEDAERNGKLQRGGTIIEPTSGNTGVGLAWVGRSRGYRVILTMPESMSVERRNLMKAFGAELVLTPAAEGMAGTVKKANELLQEIPGAIILGQFDNPANPAIHERTTGEEIWRDSEGEVDVFVAGVGTGGTVSGVGRTLKRHKANVEVVAVEPSTSQMLAKGEAGPHKIQGIGANFVPKNFDREVVDQILPISTEEAFEAMRSLSARMGLLVGISSGAAYAAALQLARKAEYKGKTIVALLPDTGERYLSMIS